MSVPPSSLFVPYAHLSPGLSSALLKESQPNAEKRKPPVKLLRQGKLERCWTAGWFSATNRKCATGNLTACCSSAGGANPTRA
jgi:hypothetical protein